MAKKEKVVDLKPTSITEEQLKAIQELVNNMNRLKLEVGDIEARKHNALHSMNQLQATLAETQKTLEEQYGRVDINVSDGSIKYIEDEQADS
tara:strand:+ start:755 stop:1030 length:276 start_codon:yes stop_codon:yes gene_type:complete